MNAKRDIGYLEQIKCLVKAYGASLVANLLDTTERGMQYWTAQEGKVPRAETQRKIHELFAKYQSGEDLRRQISHNSDYKDKYLALLESENLRLKNELSVSLVELHENLLVGKAMAATNQSMLIELLAKQRKASIDQVVLDANKLFDEFYRNMKAKDILPDGDR